MNRPPSPLLRRRTFLAQAGVLAGASAGLALPAGALAQGWPDKPVRIICNFPPGSSPDGPAANHGQRATPSIFRDGSVSNAVVRRCGRSLV